MRTLVVTNDFPPRPGGIQQYVHGLASRQPSGSVVVYASSWKGAAAFDTEQPFPVVRNPTTVLLPTPGVLREVRGVARAEGCDRVWFGASTPLGLLAPRLGLRSVASTHGHEVGWAATPGGRQVLRRIGRGVDVVTYLGPWTRARLEPAFGTHPAYARLTGGVDDVAFHPGAGGAEVRARHGIGADQPVVVCVSRLVPRKGQDVLVRVLPEVRRRVPGTVLLLVGGGPSRARLESLVAEPGSVVLTGSVPWSELPAHYDAGDVFAMPCRSRFGSLDVEGLGIVFLEAAATGLPVVAGRSGGSPDAVLEGATGYVVDDDAQVVDRLVRLLQDPPLRARMGAAGRAWVEREWRWQHLADRLSGLLEG